MENRKVWLKAIMFHCAAIIILLLCYLLLFFEPFYQGGKNSDAVAVANAIHSAIQGYHLHEGTYPSSLEELLTPLKGGKPYMESINDPWGKTFEFSVVDGQITVWTTSPEGKRLQWPR